MKKPCFETLLKSCATAQTLLIQIERLYLINTGCWAKWKNNRTIYPVAWPPLLLNISEGGTRDKGQFNYAVFNLRDEKIRVCKLFFKNTLTNRLICTVIEGDKGKYSSCKSWWSNSKCNKSIFRINSKNWIPLQKCQYIKGVHCW